MLQKCCAAEGRKYSVLQIHTHHPPLETVDAVRHPLVRAVAEQPEGMVLVTLPSREGEFWK